MTCFHKIDAWQRNNWTIEKELDHKKYNCTKDLSRNKKEKLNIKLLQEMQSAKSETKILFKNPNDKNYHKIQLPCGKCLGCRLDKANEWATRCWQESKQWDKNCFITLTYNDKNIPKDRLLNKSDLQKFWKRLRYFEKGFEEWTSPKSKKKSKPIRYLACGEYGGKTHRPHYHAAIFNWEPNDLKPYKKNHNGDMLYISKKLTEIWGMGYVIVGQLTYESSCYIARYVCKKADKSNKKDKIIKDIYEEWIETSRDGGIGLLDWIINKEKYKSNAGIMIKIKGKIKVKKISNYFKKIWKKENETEYYKYQFEQEQIGKNKLKKILSETSMNESEYMQMQEQILKDKGKLLKRDNLI